MFKSIKSIFTPIFSKVINGLELKNHFISFSVNKEDFKGTLRNRILSLEGENSHTVALGLNKEIVAQVDGSPCKFNDHDFDNYNAFVDKMFSHIVYESQELLRPSSELVSNIDEENRSLEWIRVSFKVLKEAFDDISKKDDLLYQGRVFFGKRETTILRIQALSLDILLEFLDDHRLRVRIWNYKDGVKSSDDKEDLFAEFVTLKGPVFDEIINLFTKMRSMVVI